MSSRDVSDAVDSLFVRCIASTDSMRAFRRAAALVKLLALAENGGHFVHLASALEEQKLLLQMLRTNNARRASVHACNRNRELSTFFTLVRGRITGD